MKVSGFTFLRNGAKLHYPIIESIQSALPLVDEFVIALGDSDPDDDTRDKIEALDSPLIKIVDTVWDLARFPGGSVYAQQTDVAKSHCSGDWLLYLQGDEVIHEDDYDVLRGSLERWHDAPEVEAMLFDYVHFWGDYDHAHDSHRWYRQEMRVIRNDPEIHSMKDAQSFRRIPRFDGVSYFDKTGTEKLTAVHSGARVFHYGWVRPPAGMQTKVQAFSRHHEKETDSERRSEDVATIPFDYGPLGRIPKFEGTHPKVMADRVRRFDWADSLNYGTQRRSDDHLHTHERFKYRAITWLERTFFGGRHLFASRNYVMLDGEPLPRRTNGPTARKGTSSSEASACSP
ncbi:MAG: hypothetical protein AAGA20_06645 [Planctomycetota bacterium]